jgi:hypothetical protein
MTTLSSLELGLGPAPLPELGFIYVGDLMCSWCWGFAPALEQLGRRYGLPLKVVMGGLRTGSQAEVMDADARAQLASYWQGVAERTGQPFTAASLERDGWRYDTEPSCRAVGFPTLLFRDGEELGIVTRGYVPWEHLEPALTRWLEDRYGDLTTGLTCDPTTGLR